MLRARRGRGRGDDVADMGTPLGGREDWQQPPSRQVCVQIRIRRRGGAEHPRDQSTQESERRTAYVRGGARLPAAGSDALLTPIRTRRVDAAALSTVGADDSAVAASAPCAVAEPAVFETPAKASARPTEPAARGAHGTELAPVTGVPAPVEAATAEPVTVRAPQAANTTARTRARQIRTRALRYPVTRSPAVGADEASQSRGRSASRMTPRKWGARSSAGARLRCMGLRDLFPLRRQPVAGIEPDPMRTPDDAYETGLIIGATGNQRTPWIGIAIKNLKDRRIATGGAAGNDAGTAPRRAGKAAGRRAGR